jgi:two-component system LytT family response regulator
MRVLITDDEPLAVELMSQLLRDQQEVEVIGVARSGRQAIAAIRKERPDLVFLDIEMPGLNGFAVVESLQADDFMPLIVFVTAYDKYAIDAFDVNAVDYLLKPVVPQRLQLALERARERMQQASKGKLIAAMDDARRRSGQSASSLEESAEELDRLPVRQGDSVQLLSFDDIGWVDAAGDYMCVHANGETHILRCTMKELSDRLAAGPFARIHRSTLVNLRKIREITPLTKGECLLHLDEHTQLKVSRNYRSAIQHLLP